VLKEKVGKVEKRKRKREESRSKFLDLNKKGAPCKGVPSCTGGLTWVGFAGLMFAMKNLNSDMKNKETVWLKPGEIEGALSDLRSLRDDVANKRIDRYKIKDDKRGQSLSKMGKMIGNERRSYISRSLAKTIFYEKYNAALYEMNHGNRAGGIVMYLDWLDSVEEFLISDLFREDRRKVDPVNVMYLQEDGLSEVDVGMNRVREFYFGCEQAKEILFRRHPGVVSSMVVIWNRIMEIYGRSYAVTGKAPVLSIGDRKFPSFRRGDSLIAVQNLLRRAYELYSESYYEVRDLVNPIVHIHNDIDVQAIETMRDDVFSMIADCAGWGAMRGGRELLSEMRGRLVEQSRRRIEGEIPWEYRTLELGGDGVKFDVDPEGDDRDEAIRKEVQGSKVSVEEDDLNWLETDEEGVSGRDDDMSWLDRS